MSRDGVIGTPQWQPSMRQSNVSMGGYMSPIKKMSSMSGGFSGMLRGSIKKQYSSSIAQEQISRAS